MLPNKSTKFHSPKHLVLQRKLVPQEYSSLWYGPFVSNLSPSFDNPLPSAQLSCNSYASLFFSYFLMVAFQSVDKLLVTLVMHATKVEYPSFEPWASLFNPSGRSLVVTNTMWRSSFTHNSSATIKLLYESDNLHDSNITTLLFSTIAP